MSGMSLVLAFQGAGCLLHSSIFKNTQSEAIDSLGVTQTPKAYDSLFDSLDVDIPELQYYEELADEFETSLPTDKRVVARLIDSANHHIIYFETTTAPSCYCYDLETLTTSVLFGGEMGFYIDTKLMILGNITSWMRVGDWVAFIATNRAPETSFPIAVHVFKLNLFDYSLKYIATGASAYFTDEGQVVVNKAKLLYRSLFTEEDVYTTAPMTFSLRDAESYHEEK